MCASLALSATTRHFDQEGVSQQKQVIFDHHCRITEEAALTLKRGGCLMVCAARAMSYLAPHIL